MRSSSRLYESAGLALLLALLVLLGEKKMIELLPALMVAVLAANMDLWHTRIPNTLTVGAIVLGIGVAILDGSLALHGMVIAQAAIIGYCLCVARAWAPGDLKLYLGIVSLLPHSVLWGAPVHLLLLPASFGMLLVVFVPLAGLFALVVRGNGYTFRQVFLDTLRARVPFAPFLLGGLLLLMVLL